MRYNETNFGDLMEVLKSIEGKLDVLIILYKTNLPRAKVGEEEEKILKLCNRKHTVEDMAKKTGKTENNVKVILSRLRDKALISTLRMKGETVYERI